LTRYFIYFSYDGTNYHGWQIQSNGNTIQAEIHHALSVLLRKQIEVIGAGRTDTGVHARLMVAHFDGDDNIDVVQLAYRLNRILPQDIAVHEVKPVSEDMHARFSAKSRTYRYYIHFKKNPFHRAYSYEIHYDLDFDAMNNAASYLLRQSDFTSFCKTGTDAKTMICHVTHAQWHKMSDNAWYFEITANRFLRNMVRAVVGTLIEVGRHRMDFDAFKKVISDKTRTAAGESMPGHALFLEDITY
jgi:tRNA pseudouridine38-40 synthase